MSEQASPVEIDSDLGVAFGRRTSEVFGGMKRSRKTALEEALGLWLAWRGDSSYLITAVGKRPERESAWRVVGYTKVPELAKEYDQVEARSLAGAFPDQVLAFFARHIIAEVERRPGAEVFSEMVNDLGIQRARASAGQTFALVKDGRSVSVSWASKGAPGLASRTIALTGDRFQSSAYPLLDAASGKTRGNGPGFLKLLAKSARKKKVRWVASHE